MKFTQLYIFLTCFFLIASQSVDAQQTMTMEEVINSAAGTSFQSVNAAQNQAIATADHQLYFSQLKPQVRLEATVPNYLKTSTAITQPDGSIAFRSVSQHNAALSLTATQDIPFTGGQLFLQTDLQRFDDLSADTKLYNGIPMRIGLIQPIFGYNRFKFQNKIVELNKNIAAKNYTIETKNSIAIASGLYFDILIAKENNNIAKTNSSINEKLLTITKERLELGKATKDELLQLNIELQNAKLSNQQSALDVVQAVLELNTFLGKDLTDTSDNFTWPETPETILLDEEKMISKAISHRPEIMRFQRSILEAEDNYAQQKFQYGIQATLFASYGFAKGAGTLEGIYRDPLDEQQLRLSVSVPIVDWGTRKAARKSATLQIEQAKMNNNQALLEMKNQVRRLVRTFHQQQQALELIKNTMDLAEERSQISNERYILGNISITDLTIAQREKNVSRINYVRALKDYWQTYYLIEVFCGNILD